MRNHAHRIAGNGLLELISRGFEIGTATIIVILTARYFGLKEFGEYAFIRSIGFILAPLITFGTVRILIRDIAIKRDQAGIYISTGLIVNILFAVIAYAIAATIAFFFSITSTEYVLSLYLSILSHALIAMRLTVTSVFFASEKLIYSTSTNIFSRSLLLIFVVAVIYTDLGFISIFIALVLANAAGFVVAVFLANRILVKSIWGLDVKHFKYLLKEAYPVALSSSLTQGYTYISVFFIKSFQTVTQVSLFQASQRIIAPLILFPRAFLLALYPTISRLAKKDDSFSSLRILSRYIIKYILILTLPLCLYGTIYRSAIIELIFGKEFLEATNSFQILIWILLPLFLNLFIDFTLTSINKQRVLIVSNGISFAVTLILSLFLVQKYGYIGVCWASLIAYICLFSANYFYLSKYIGFVQIHDIATKAIIASSISYLLVFLLADRYNMLILSTTSFVIYWILLGLFKVVSVNEVDFLKSIYSKRYRYT